MIDCGSACMVPQRRAFVYKMSRQSGRSARTPCIAQAPAERPCCLRCILQGKSERFSAFPRRPLTHRAEHRKPAKAVTPTILTPSSAPSVTDPELAERLEHAETAK